MWIRHGCLRLLRCGLRSNLNCDRHQHREFPVMANRVEFERRPERPVYPRPRTSDRRRPPSWPGGPLYLGQPTPLGEVRQDRV
jgi:hypothetical protein